MAGRGGGGRRRGQREQEHSEGRERCGDKLKLSKTTLTKCWFANLSCLSYACSNSLSTRVHQFSSREAEGQGGMGGAERRCSGGDVGGLQVLSRSAHILRQGPAAVLMYRSSPSNHE